MKPYRILLPALFFTALLGLSLAVAADETAPAENPLLMAYTLKQGNIELKIPRQWHKSEYDLGYKHILALTGKGRAWIKITASVRDDEEKRKWDRWQEWYCRESGSVITTILDNREIAPGHGIKGNLTVFESRKGRERFLNRILVAPVDEYLVTIECRAPLPSFPRHAFIFDAAMSSVGRTSHRAQK
jgi:hypothetical protein